MMQHSEADAFCNFIYDIAKNDHRPNQLITKDKKRTLIIQNLNDADHILRKNNKNYIKNSKWLSQVAGQSRLTEDGEKWSFLQKISQPTFAKYDTGRAVTVCAIHGKNIAQQLLEETESHGISERIIHQGISAIFTQMFLEIELDSIPLVHDHPSKLIELASHYAFSTPGNKDFSNNKDSIKSILELRKKTFLSLSELRNDQWHKSPLLLALLEAEKNSAFNFTFEKELTTLFNAGTDTASYSIGWALHILANQPEIQEVLHHEISRLYTASTGNNNDLEIAICQNPLLRAFISELLRLYPPLPFVSRIALQDDQLGDIQVKAEDVIIISLVAINEKAMQRNNPWVVDLAAAQNEGFGMGSGAISGFIWGPHVCGGRSFALTMLAVVLGHILKVLRFEPSSDEPVVYEWVGQMRRKGGHRVRAIAR